MKETLFSVLLTTYEGDTPQELDAALDSTINQTRPPEEIVLVKDGPLTEELTAVVDSYVDRYPDLFSIHRLRENRGRGAAAAIGLKHCTNDLVGIMSADDVNVSNRFERLINFLKDNPEVDVVGGFIAEFDEELDEEIDTREVPTDPEDIRQFALRRCPMNEVTVMFRKNAVLNVGGYRGLDKMEDYDLWVRLLVNGSTLANIPEVLVHVRTGEGFSSRRGGFKYAREEIRQQIEFFKWGFLSFPRFIANVVTRVPLRLVGNSIRDKLYKIIAR
ncbi:glycosyltransferase involved in cell wall biosynthesis [Salinibacter ruber]|uniref:glycosyltransferase n=1 Tax=Salinibacter ruber TaxID=146919 RepID=UPI002167E135|nr:glycosyltransferase [Salinibacter ruber]MCS3856504.1 glycosyltransferase involved in cell wall biosynthesis [Salinibacter ruber]